MSKLMTILLYNCHESTQMNLWSSLKPINVYETMKFILNSNQTWLNIYDNYKGSYRNLSVWVMHVGFFIVILYMYESSKDNIDSYICGLHLYIYIYVCEFFKLVGRLSTLIFGRLHIYVCMWIFKVSKFE